LDYFTKAIEMKQKHKNILYRNRGYLHESMKTWRAAIDDFVDSELEYSEEKTLNLIEGHIKKDASLLVHTMTSYYEKKGDNRSSEPLEKLLEDYGKQHAVNNQEVAAALEQHGIIREQA